MGNTIGSEEKETYLSDDLLYQEEEDYMKLEALTVELSKLKEKVENSDKKIKSLESSLDVAKNQIEVLKESLRNMSNLSKDIKQISEKVETNESNINNNASAYLTYLNDSYKAIEESSKLLTMQYKNASLKPTELDQYVDLTSIKP